MPSYVIKPDPDVDWYVYWSTIVEAPIAFGDRKAMLNHPEIIETRLHRADLTGTSCLVGFYSWDQEELIYEQRGTVLRSDLPEFCSVLIDDEAAAIRQFVTPFEAES